MKIQRIDSTNWQTYSQDLESLCRSSEADDSPAAVNYHWKGWESNPGSLMNALVRERRYDLGFLDLLYEDDGLTAVSGCYAADWNPSVLVMGSRAYTRRDRRGHHWFHGEHLFPRQWQYAQDHGYQAIIVSFNDYNDRLLRFINLAAAGRIRFPVPDFYRHLRVLPGRYWIKHTPQLLTARLVGSTTWDDFQDLLPPPVEIE